VIRPLGAIADGIVSVTLVRLRAVDSASGSQVNFQKPPT